MRPVARQPGPAAPPYQPQGNLLEFGRLDHFFDCLTHLIGYLLQTGLQRVQLLLVIFAARRP
jgi:hypothetical protein